MADFDDLRERIALREVKSQYFRAIDTKNWKALRSVLDDDLVYWRDLAFDELSATPATVGADEFVENVARRHRHSVTVHHGHDPQIEILEENAASGVWAMFDWVDNHELGHAWAGYGHYREDYRRDPDGRWRINRMRLSRVRLDILPTTEPESIQASVAAWQRGELPRHDHTTGNTL